MRQMRASILAVAPLLARIGKISVDLPGGCTIGARPVDLHALVLQSLGAEVTITDTNLQASLRGSAFQAGRVDFPIISVGATETALLAMSITEGESIIGNAACEPEIIALADFLELMGAKITGAGTPNIKVQGRRELKGASMAVIPDRIEAASYALLVAAVGGNLELDTGIANGGDFLHNSLPLKIFADIGIGYRKTKQGCAIWRKQADILHGLDVSTAPYPGFATDLQPQLMVALCLADGASHLYETIFENRFRHIHELVKMGAKIEIADDCAIISGLSSLVGAHIESSDLRAAFALVMAALAAEGESIFTGIEYLNRGYADILEKLRSIGADIAVIDSKDFIKNTDYNLQSVA